jgi:hypothetical protein
MPTEYAISGRAYGVRRLTGDDLLRAFPLARLAAGHLTPAAWLRFASALGAKKPRDGTRDCEGWLGVEDSRGYLYSLCSFAVRPDLRTGRLLDVDNLVAADLIDGGNLARALLAALERLARDHDCPAYVVRLPPSAPGATSQRLLADMAGRGGREQTSLFRTL